LQKRRTAVLGEFMHHEQKNVRNSEKGGVEMTWSGHSCGRSGKWEAGKRIDARDEKRENDD
jgi:hypothetical protein